MSDSMTCEQFEAILPQLLDDESELTPMGRDHLGRCESCRSLYGDLQAVRVRAGALPPLAPERDLWAGIEARIEAPVVRLASTGPRRRQLSWRAAGVAAAVLVALTSAITYGIARRTVVAPASVASRQSIDNSTLRVATTIPSTDSQGSRVTTPAAPPTSKGGSITIPVTPAPVRVVPVSAIGSSAATYDRQIAQLRAIVDSGRMRLDPATVALLERNLGVIDSAIAQCQRALVKDPASRFLIESLNNSYQTKVKLLRIAAAATKG